MRLLPLALASALLWGQSFTGTVSGTVQDASGAVVPATKILLINSNTNERRAQQSNADGSYLFPLVPPGSYRLEAEASGFKKMIRPNIVVEVNQSLRIDAVLEVGSAAESVQVTAETPLLQPNTSSLGQVVDNRKIVEFPLAGRNTFALIYHMVTERSITRWNVDASPPLAAQVAGLVSLVSWTVIIILGRQIVF